MRAFKPNNPSGGGDEEEEERRKKFTDISKDLSSLWGRKKMRTPPEAEAAAAEGLLNLGRGKEGPYCHSACFRDGIGRHLFYCNCKNPAGEDNAAAHRNKVPEAFDLNQLPPPPPPEKSDDEEIQGGGEPHEAAPAAAAEGDEHIQEPGSSNEDSEMEESGGSSKNSPSSPSTDPDPVCPYCDRFYFGGEGLGSLFCCNCGYQSDEDAHYKPPPQE
ncbi:PREDICTED: uncharacterized protein LOC109152209 [Ipomoea nil]|uniref:uncharacterized protein LOC109152209 n=1 Tax=Ipomoea nil TaxID=35883 RepID=UPI0009015C40|nr:PREDICTED: uncharacterized protein LOC109152209 [Ipomoea nil]